MTQESLCIELGRASSVPGADALVSYAHVYLLMEGAKSACTLQDAAAAPSPTSRGDV